MINYLLLLSALLITSISGYISVVGLTTIFSSPSSFYVVAGIGIALEVAKVLAISWLHRYWNLCNKLLKTYLVLVILLLVFLNMMSSFGFLSRAHIEQTVAINTGSAEQIENVRNKIEFEKQTIADIDTQVQQIDAAISKMTDRGQAKSSLAAAAQYRKTRDALVKRKDEHVQSISALTEQRVKLESNIKRLEAEVGPIKYIADLIYTKADSDQLEKAVRIIILLIVSVFDPLAVVLLIAANFGLGNKKKLTQTKKSNILEIDNIDLEHKTSDIEI